jgi:hypothetical protein
MDARVDTIRFVNAGIDAIRLVSTGIVDAIQLVNVRGVPGTLGCLLRSGADTELFLTAHHVLYGAGAGTGDRVWAVLDTGDEIDAEDCGSTYSEVGRTVSGRIGRVTLRGETSFVDCAVGVLARGDRPASLRRALRATPQLAVVAPPRVGERVVKGGAVTGVTGGVIVDAAYFDRPFIDGREYEAPGQILIRSADEALLFSAPGDSGAVVLDAQGRAIGLLWGSTVNGEGIACPMAAVLDQLARLGEPQAILGAPRELLREPHDDARGSWRPR